ncbi:hypothetical protein CY652_12875 [Burkholderia sp. WAC0059]|uniref:GSCFA domain-containing protein n=1 Tax=Burkholderia sp. WAC0059 TaxID=2066022 RepID=UPI000C7F1BA0|nr:GSCFA domain-containing protein [Burkholderia sp. WAC0059]PLZ01926.1 hypothetical protein CY652_12875 [Burkholderia sp. WAC0059]
MISIVIPAYNCANYLPDSIESVLQQGIVDIELIVYDDGSTDDTPEIAKAFASRDSRVKYVLNQKSLGAVHNINQGVRMAEGDFIQILGPGHVLVPDGLQALKSALDAHPECGYAYGRYAMLDKDGQRRSLRQPGWMNGNYFGTRAEFPHLLQFDPYIDIEGATLFRRAALGTDDFFDTSLDASVSAFGESFFRATDLALVLRLSAQGVRSAFVDRDVSISVDQTELTQSYEKSGLSFLEFSVLLKKYFTVQTAARLVPHVNDILKFYMGKLDTLRTSVTPELSGRLEICVAYASEILATIRSVIAEFSRENHFNLAENPPSPASDRSSSLNIDVWKNQAKQALSTSRGIRETIATVETQGVSESDWEAHLLLGLLYGRTDNVAKAIRHLELSLVHNARNPDTVFFLGQYRCHLVGSHKGWAIQRDHARNALRLIENTPNPASWPQLKLCLETLAQMATYVGPTEEAEYAYRWLIRLDPENASYYAKLSQLRANDNFEEAIELLDKAQSLNPNVTDKSEAEFSRELRRSSSRRSPKTRAKYPTTTEMSGDLKSVVESTLVRGIAKQNFITRNTRFFTLGSCFAREVAARLRERGYQADYFQVAEHINSTFANRSLMDWVFGRCEGQPRQRLDELFAPLNVTPENLKARLAAAEVFVYTLGVAPAFFDRKSKEFVMPTDSLLGTRAFAELFDFRTTTVQENLENLEYITSCIKSLNPDARIVITVSPVPLHATFEFKSAIQADCISKSILRIVAHEFASKYPETIYWPGFEVVRWLGGHVGPYYGLDDGAAWHIGDDIVKTITDLFIEHFSDSAAGNIDDGLAGDIPEGASAHV